jgi:hypothetical protein
MKRLGKTRKIPIAGIMAGILLLSGAPLFTARANADPAATLVIPVAVLETLIQEALPVEIENAEGFSGRLWVRAVEKLYLGKNRVSFQIRVQGKDVSYSREIAGYPAAMKFGAVDLAFQCTAVLSYDRKQRVLAVKPRIRPAEQVDDLLTPLLMALVNESEYVVKVEKLEPIETQLGKSPMTAHMDISNITTSENRMMIAIVPRIQKRGAK